MLTNNDTQSVRGELLEHDGVAGAIAFKHLARAKLNMYITMIGHSKSISN
jgi:hypothetical protein